MKFQRMSDGYVHTGTQRYMLRTGWGLSPKFVFHRVNQSRIGGIVNRNYWLRLA